MIIVFMVLYTSAFAIFGSLRVVIDLAEYSLKKSSLLRNLLGLAIAIWMGSVVLISELLLIELLVHRRADFYFGFLAVLPFIAGSIFHFWFYRSRWLDIAKKMSALREPRRRNQ